MANDGCTGGLAWMQALDEALGSACAALEANKRGLEVGVCVSIDVLDGQQQVSATERDLVRSRCDTLLCLQGAAGSFPT